MVLHLLSAFIQLDGAIGNNSPTYWYEGCCPFSGKLVRLPRTLLAESIARGLMQQLAMDDRYSREGKMYGVLLVETFDGKQRVLKAFSGLLQGNSIIEGWVPPIPGRDRIVLEEAHTLSILNLLKQELIALEYLPERQDYEALAQEFETQLRQLIQCHQRRKQERQQQRHYLYETRAGSELIIALEQLDQQSRLDGIDRRRLKQQRDIVLQPLRQKIEHVDARMQALKQQRKVLSRQLQAQMHRVYSLTNFAGQSRSLHQLMPRGLSTGTGDCCAPKLLHHAATHGLKPLAMAEFWWGLSSVSESSVSDSPIGDKIQGEFYGACTERCQPLMGFLLSGSPQREPIAPVNGTDRSLSLLYEDEWLIAVNKPAGLLSVPGRYRDRQDSVLSRLRHELSEGSALIPIHRLDQDTSGLLLLARNTQTYRQLSQQFQYRQVHKVYEALLVGAVALSDGIIDLPLWSDPDDRPYQKVDWQRGKPSLTHYRVLAEQGEYTRVELIPITGRTHQLRVHAADARGLGVAIWGDRLYGCHSTAARLHLHARELCFKHPQSGEVLSLYAKTPF
ncbi:MAG: RluA family pseudouridine synthase [Cyanobacteria bacterium CRU_2_1]|nr:RluA family pseudouridine synthase [Cyanobacteria bacterium RU_5_0]NJR58411.1 RluA family pseudouridine synthase [Cyanobacteria bacterium CRU_2_1]